MLGRKRGGLADRQKKMAKKGAALQTEVNNDEEWMKVLQRPGLVLVDIYSEWSGPCAGMVSVLKKIKMELGGDDLSYAIAKCDYISSLARFRGRSEPIWMFIRGGKTVNIAFGANCPQLTDLLLREIQRVQKNEPPEFAVNVDEVSEKEAVRMAAQEEAKRKKEAALNARKEMQAKKRYEARMEHLKHALQAENMLIMFPWCFKDDEGNKRDKKASPVFMDMIERLFPNKFAVDSELRKVLEEETFEVLKRETDVELSEETKGLMLDDSCYIFRLKLRDVSQDNVENFLISLLYDDTKVPESPDSLVEGCFVHRHLPQQYSAYTGEEERRESAESNENEGGEGGEGEGGEGESIPERHLFLTTAWVPFNARNKCLAMYHFFPQYIDKYFPYEEAVGDLPFMLFKFDTTKRAEIEPVYKKYHGDVVHFGVFDRDNVPHPTLIADSLGGWDSIQQAQRTGYEVIVCAVIKDNNEAFLSFAGLGPYHVSENPDIAIDEAKLFFPPEADGENDGDEGSEEEEEDEGSVSEVVPN